MNTLKSILISLEDDDIIVTTWCIRQLVARGTKFLCFTGRCLGNAYRNDGTSASVYQKGKITK
jgi:hypothetical protein